MKKYPWLYFSLVQCVNAIAFLIGVVLLAFMSALKLWKPAQSVNWPGRTINGWRGKWIDKVWGNDEDGVTGAPFYEAQFPSERIRAYMWSAWRNFANNLRFVFRWFPTDGAPFYHKEFNGPDFSGTWWKPWTWRVTWIPWYYQAGWYPNGFPVISGGKIG